MKMTWTDTPTHWGCSLDKPVEVKLRPWGIGSYEPRQVKDMGYVLPRDGRFMACIYGSINPDTPGKFFDHIDDAKAYVETQALLGLTLNKLTR